MKFRMLLLIAAAFAQTACAKTPEPICQELDATIDGSIKHVALTLAEGEISDKGAMQQAARYISANNHLQVIRITLDLQSQNKCPVRKTIINPLMYQLEAMNCLAATLGNKEEMTNLCDIKNWKGNSK